VKDFENPDFITKLSVDTARFVYDEAQKYLAETIETAKILTDRAVSIMQFTIPVSIGIILLLFDHHNSRLLTHISIIALLGCLIVTWNCLKVYQLYQILPVGNTPERVITVKKLEGDDEKQLKTFLISAILSTQKSIEFNRNENKTRSALIFSILTTMKLVAGLILLYTILWFPVFQSLFP